MNLIVNLLLPLLLLGILNVCIYRNMPRLVRTTAVTTTTQTTTTTTTVTANDNAENNMTGARGKSTGHRHR